MKVFRKLQDVWAPRVGSPAAALLEKRLYFSQLGGLVGLLTILGSSLSLLADSPSGETIAILSGVLGMIVCFSFATHYLIAAQKEAALHLTVPDSIRKFMPLRNVERFDSWISQQRLSVC